MGRLFQGVGDLSKSYFGRLERRAETQGVPFSLTIEQSEELFRRQRARCALSGLPIELKRLGWQDGKSGQTAVLDRIDSSLGYELRNVRWIHSDVASAKQQLSDGEFIALCKRVAAHHRKRSQPGR